MVDFKSMLKKAAAEAPIKVDRNDPAAKVFETRTPLKEKITMNDIVTNIVLQTGIPREDVNARIQEKIASVHGLLTELGAGLVMAEQLHVDVNRPIPEPEPEPELDDADFQDDSPAPNPPVSAGTLPTPLPAGTVTKTAEIAGAGKAAGTGIDHVYPADQQLSDFVPSVYSDSAIGAIGALKQTTMNFQGGIIERMDAIEKLLSELKTGQAFILADITSLKKEGKK